MNSTTAIHLVQCLFDAAVLWAAFQTAQNPFQEVVVAFLGIIWSSVDRNRAGTGKSLLSGFSTLARQLGTVRVKLGALDEGEFERSAATLDEEVQDEMALCKFLLAKAWITRGICSLVILRHL